MDSVRTTIGGLGNLLFKQAYLWAQMRDGLIPDVYLQDESYFKKYENDIRLMYGQGILYEPYVALHVRRGDYVDNPFYVDLMKDGYYRRAMSLFPDDFFMVFSDDIEWCKQQRIFFSRCSFSEEKDTVDDFNKMASCKGHIIANSSFSWWAAWLSPHGGKVISPKRWYSDGIERTKLPAHWVRV